MQHEIMDIVWNAGVEGIATSEVWQLVGEKRKVARTTILNQVDRLEKRGWLVRRKAAGSYRYQAAIDREETERLLADQFVNHFFRGSPGRLVASLLGGKKIDDADVRQIREILESLPEDDQQPPRGEDIQ
ncbi:MAG: BlaI/MecI/CopY family transcriptional regulator [Pirellulales bacterium]|nr:BlaI/MecI/CopY family transcriptional regulator [Pirellulales bacterium]